MPKKTQNSPWFRNCPKCGKVLYYANKRNLNRAIENGRSCNTCRVISIEQRQKIRETNLKKGIRPPVSQPYSELDKIFSRICPRCKEKIWHTTKRQAEESGKHKRLCNRCSAYIYQKNWIHIISKESLRKMRATKAGYSSWEEYEKEYPKKKRYKAEVWRFTYQQPLETLENYNMRGRCGVENAYQIDHIISVDEGYKKNISVEKIGHISNLQMLPWRKNLKKSNK